MSEIRHLSPVDQGLVSQRRPDDGRQNFMDVGQPLDRIGQGLFVDLGVLRPDAVAQRAVGSGSNFEVHGETPTLIGCGRRAGWFLPDSLVLMGANVIGISGVLRIGLIPLLPPQAYVLPVKGRVDPARRFCGSTILAAAIASRTGLTCAIGFFLGLRRVACLPLNIG